MDRPRHRDSPPRRRDRDTRSRSPAHKRPRTTRSPSRDDERRRRHHHHHHHRSHRHHGKHHRDSPAEPPASLPFSARPLGKSDLRAFRPLFAYFLSLQKQIELDDLDEREERGRWKSFVGKWNRGELAEGWYDPEMYQRVVEEAGPDRPREQPARMSPGRDEGHREEGRDREEEERQDEEEQDDDDDEDYGPPPPPGTAASSKARGPGPTIPSMQDISLRDEMRQGERDEAAQRLREERRAERGLHRERLEELAGGRADPGSHERRMEKRRAAADAAREFREAKSPGADEGAGADEGELMGGGDSVDDYKRAKEREVKRKTERQLRREEMERARLEEIEERRRAWQEREEGTVNMLRELAKQRFG